MSAHSITWAPLLAWQLLAALTAVAALLVLFSLFKRAQGTWWRVLTLAVLLLALANPSLLEEQRQGLDDVVIVIADDSASQKVGDRTAQSEAALSDLLAGLERLPDTEIHLVRAASDTRHVEKRGTRLFEALQQALAKVPRQRVGGVIVISDGQVHDVPEDFASLGLTAPVHLLLSGRESEGDRRLKIEQAPSFGIVGKKLTLKATVEDLIATPTKETAELILRQDGILRQRIEVPVGVAQEIEFELEHRGPSVLEIEVSPGPQELSLANNRSALVVAGVRERLRVLLVSGEPHAGERAWRNILKSDPSVDLVHFTILRPPEKQDGTPIRELSLIAFPTRELFEIKLDEFDLVIFDRYRRRGVLPSIYLNNIAQFVDSGGALLEAVGPTFATPLSLYRTPLGRVLPGEPSGNIFEEGFLPRLTDLGQRHPVTAGLPGSSRDPQQAPQWGRWFRQIDVDNLDGSVLMSGVQERPLLILDRVGEGRVAQILSDHMWLWARGFEGGGPQAELLRRIAHWLMKEPDLEEEDLRATISGGRLDIQRRSLESDLPQIEVTSPSGRKQRIDLNPGPSGTASASIPAAELGLYRLSDGQRVALAAAGVPNPKEFQDLRSTAELLGPLVQASGGAITRLVEAGTPDVRKVKPDRSLGGRGWIGVVESGSYVVTGVSQVALLPGLLVLLLALGAGIAAWYREGH